MSEQKLIAEIGDNQIKYAVFLQEENSNYKILNKKISEDSGIIKGKILNFDYTAQKINTDIKNLEKELNVIFKNIIILINEPETSCTNLSGFKKLNGSKVEKRDLDYILSEAKNSILKNQEKNSILHILNSNFILDKIKKNKIPLNLHGDHLSLHVTFILLPTNNLKNIKAIFNNSDLKIDRVISKPLANGLDLLNRNKGAKNFVLINFDKEVCSISLYEDSSLVFLKTFPFGTNSIYNDINQLCSINKKEIKNILKEHDFINKDVKNTYLDKKYFVESKFKKLTLDHIKEITNARINEILNYIFNKNKNLNYINDKILRLHLYFEDKDVLENLGEVFINSLNVNKDKTQIELLPINEFSALSGAAELIFKGWDKEAIPTNLKKRSVISSFFERLF